jgi:hypothetical protein
MWKHRRLGDVWRMTSSIAARAPLPQKSLDANIIGPDQ